MKNGEHIKTKRLAARLTQKQVAELMGIARESYLRAEQRNPSDIWVSRFDAALKKATGETIPELLPQIPFKKKQDSHDNERHA